MSLYGFFFILMLLGIVVWTYALYALFDMSREKVKPKKATMKKVHSDLLQMQHQLEEVNEKVARLSKKIAMINKDFCEWKKLCATIAPERRNTDESQIL